THLLIIRALIDLVTSRPNSPFSVTYENKSGPVTRGDVRLVKRTEDSISLTYLQTRGMDVDKTRYDLKIWREGTLDSSHLALMKAAIPILSATKVPKAKMSDASTPEDKGKEEEVEIEPEP